MSQHEQFDLNRQVSLENKIDPTGKKWEVHGERGTALVHARPNPDREDAVIPDSFKGKWTSPTVLREKIDVWLNQQWNKSDTKAHKADGKKRAKKVSAEESLDALPKEIKEELGDVLATEET
jgi:hypothetical protein